MGIINLTPDSFWESSRCNADSALKRMQALRHAGADMFDIGAISTRPGATEISLEEEWSRLEPFLRIIPKGTTFSIDTTRSEIVERAFRLCGPFIVNDISAGEDDPQMLEITGRLGLDYIAMHKRGTAETMDSLCDYPEGVTKAVSEYFKNFEKKAQKAGIKNWILDPGFGFAKTAEQNMTLLKDLPKLKLLGRPVLVGISHKRFTRGREKECNILAIQGGADILRVHELSDDIKGVS